VHHGEGADQQGECLRGFHAEGDGQQDGDGAGATQAGNEAHDEAGRDPDHEHEQQPWISE
jgi:hypothetical protein